MMKISIAASVARILALPVITGLILSLVLLTQFAIQHDGREPAIASLPTSTNSSRQSPVQQSVESPTPASIYVWSPVAEPTRVASETAVIVSRTDATATHRVSSPTPSSQPTTVPQPHSPIVRLSIPTIGVDASIEVIGVDADGVMQAPSSPDIVGWYDFSAHPNDAGNAVFAGHVDYAGVGPAVFWSLSELQFDDIIELHEHDGTTVRYRVTSVQPYPADTNALEIVASTGEPIITLITCGGSFDPVTRRYDERLIVVGARID